MNNIMYWDVFPKAIKVSKCDFDQRIPLSIRGNIEAPIIETSNDSVASIDNNGCIVCGQEVGSCVVLIWKDESRTSLRHVQVEIWNPLQGICGGGSNGNDPNPILVAGSITARDTNTGVSDASVRIVKSENNEVAAEFHTDGQGLFTVRLQPGEYSINVSADGFLDYSGALIVSTNAVTGKDIVLDRDVAHTALAEMVLTWSDPNLQLHAHLTGPKPTGGGLFHIYNDNLQIDPVAEVILYPNEKKEIVRIYHYLHDMFRLYIHDYTNRQYNPSWALAWSGATIQLRINGQEYTFSIPQNPGTVWRVLEIDGNTGQYHLINGLDYRNDPSQVGM